MAKEKSIKSFHEALILAKWALNFFGAGTFEALKRALSDARLEGIDDESGNTKFFHALTTNYLIPLNRIRAETLCEYDKRIVNYWQAITEKRNADEGQVLNLKYFQWLSLLVTELYLDYYFNKKQDLLSELNVAVANYNAGVPASEGLKPIEENDLNKIAFWEATGAGKTLLLHVNIKQYLYYAGTQHVPSRIILLTPNEGLSWQHLRELELSGFSAAILKENDLFAHNSQIWVIDAVKLISEKSNKKKGEKSMFAESFEGQNLVLVDEGHNGSTSENGERRTVRNQLCRDGFSFEYSATFGQAVGKTPSLFEVYAKAILFDYSYKYFHADGYGKDAFILNMEKADGNDAQRFEYLCACLLKFFQQREIFAKNPATMREYGIENPLCVFVGTTVNKLDSDVETLVQFLAKIVGDPAGTQKVFGELLNDKPVILSKGGHNLFHDCANVLKNAHGNAETLYKAVLKNIFNADAPAKLTVKNLKSVGEILLACGNAEPFALVNIGDSDAFAKKIAGTLDVLNDDFDGSHFAKINESDSKIAFLIGSRKFTEGWSSWRVATMGLLNIGQNEGTQIIQLFGRGVRLRGKDFSLKRSTPEERRGKNIAFLSSLETLNIFGIRANYMDAFRKYLNEEGVETVDEILQITFAPKKIAIPAGTRLKKLALKNGYGLRQKNGFRTQAITLFEISNEDKKRIEPPIAEYSDFALVQSINTVAGTSTAGTPKTLPNVKFDNACLPFFNWDKIYRELMTYKAEKSYFNLRLSRERLETFCKQNNDWYRLCAPEEHVRFDDFEKLPQIEAIFKKLLFNYTDKFYNAFKNCYESQHKEAVDLTGDEAPEQYIFEIDRGNDEQNSWRERLEKLKTLVENQDVPALKKSLAEWSDANLVAIVFERHLYAPLIFKDAAVDLPFTFKPLSFDAKSEFQFVKDLQAYYEANPEKFADKDLYLMRNAANKSRGIGFGNAGNFYPDFLMWIIDKTTGKQYLTFIDPKGLRNLTLDNPKLNFAREVKNLQVEVNKNSAAPLVLNSIILSATGYEKLLFSEMSKNDLEARNIFFLADGGNDYLPKVFRAILRKNE